MLHLPGKYILTKNGTFPRVIGISVHEAVSTWLKGKSSEERAGRAIEGGKENGSILPSLLPPDLGPPKVGNRNRVPESQKAVKKGAQVMTTQHALQTPCRHYSWDPARGTKNALTRAQIYSQWF